MAGSERARNGAGGDRLRQGDAPTAADGGDHIDRPWRPQPRDRRRRGDGQPLARVAVVGRHVPEPATRPRAATGRTLRQPVDDGERRVPRRRPLLGPDHPARASHPVVAPSPRHDARPGRVRAGVHRPAPRRASRGLRLPRAPVRASRPRDRPPTSRRRPGRRGDRHAAPGEPPVDRRRGRGALLARRGRPGVVRRASTGSPSSRRSPASRR